MAKVVRVYGKADSFDIELSRNGDVWEVDIPPDMTDGVYAVQLTAIDKNGDWAIWTGELFMVNGICCMKLKPSPLRTSIDVGEYTAEFVNTVSVSLETSDYCTQPCKKYNVQIVKTADLPKYMSQIVKKTDVISVDSAFSVSACVGGTEVKKKTEPDFLYITGKEILFRKERCYVHR